MHLLQITKILGKKLIDDEEEEASNSSSGGGQILFSTITKTSDHENSGQSKVRKNRGPRSKSKFVNKF